MKRVILISQEKFKLTVAEKVLDEVVNEAFEAPENYLYILT